MTTDVDCSGVGQAVWLIKVPKYVSSLWHQADAQSGIVGTLQINKNPQKNEVLFNLSEPLASKEDTKDTKLPRQYKMLMSKVDQSLAVLSEGPSAEEEGDEKSSDKAKLAIQGVVVQRADCRPTQSLDYMLMKKKSILQASKPSGQAKFLAKGVVHYKPVADHAANIQYEKKKKEEGKRARADQEEVRAQLFAAFERHQYYNLKDLVKITQQPIVYLKSILKEIGTYNTKNPHKNMWELKREYRHYEKSNEDGSSS